MVVWIPCSSNRKQVRPLLEELEESGSESPCLHTVFWRLLWRVKMAQVKHLIYSSERTGLTYTDVELFIDGFLFISLSDVQVPDQWANCDSLDNK